MKYLLSSDNNMTLQIEAYQKTTVDSGWKSREYVRLI
jgi:hypothetical protein